MLKTNIGTKADGVAKSVNMRGAVLSETLFSRSFCTRANCCATCRIEGVVFHDEQRRDKQIMRKQNMPIQCCSIARQLYKSFFKVIRQAPRGASKRINNYRRRNEKCLIISIRVDSSIPFNTRPNAFSEFYMSLLRICCSYSYITTTITKKNLIYF